MSYYSHITECRTLECIFLFLRLSAVTAPTLGVSEDEEDARISLAKAYIEDNIRTSVSASELASYCHLCVRHLERLFRRETGVSIAQYIRAKRTSEIERLLADPSLSLRAISEKMSFANEYYFNVFFKKHAGMSPGAYRKTILKHL